MKSITGILTFVLFATATFFFFQNAQAQSNKKTETVEIQTSAVCGMCKARIEKALGFEKGIKSSSLDLETMKVTVVYDPKKTDVEKIKTAITKTGYDADDMPADEKAYEKLHWCCKKDSKHH